MLQEMSAKKMIFTKRLFFVLQLKILFIIFQQMRILNCQNHNINELTCLGEPTCIYGIKLNCSYKNITFLHLHCASPYLLKVLYLNNNRISYIYQNTFENLTSLKSLYLNDNHLYKIEEHTFSSLESLQYLHLSNNKIMQIHENSFKNLHNLLFIDLDNNQLTVINPGTFTSCNSLWQVHLIRNKIKYIDENSFKKDSHIKHLYCSNNELSEIGFLKNLSALTYLDLSYNHIKTIPHMTLTQTSLKKLNLSYNKLEMLRSGTIGDLLVLDDLNLSHNKLQDLGEGQFDYLYALKSLDLRNNLLTSFSYGNDFGKAIKNISIYIDNNNWYCDHIHAIRQLPNIELIYYYKNRSVSNIAGIPCTDTKANFRFVSGEDNRGLDIPPQAETDHLLLYILIGVGIMLIFIVTASIMLLKKFHQSYVSKTALPPPHRKTVNNVYQKTTVNDDEDEALYEEI